MVDVRNTHTIVDIEGTIGSCSTSAIVATERTLREVGQVTSTGAPCSPSRGNS